MKGWDYLAYLIIGLMLYEVSMRTITFLEAEQSFGYLYNGLIIIGTIGLALSVSAIIELHQFVTKQINTFTIEEHIKVKGKEQP